jgi:asparagine synthase (glutamine-hydrolysing)
VPFSHAVPTYVEGVEQILGGECAIVANGSFRKWRYWSVEDSFARAVNEPRNPQDYVDEYQALLDDSVRKHLMSDVPIGAFLSGGLDSSLVVAAAARYRADIHCFSVLEESTFRSGDAVAARQLADALAVPFHQVHFDHERLADQVDFDLSTLEYFVWLLDSPRFALEWLLKHELHRYAKTVVPDLKVILLGQGADEFAGGYSHEYRQRMGEGDGWSRYAGALADISRAHFLERRQVPEPLRALLARQYIQRLSPDGFQAEARRRLVTLQTYNLWHEDRTAAANGTEARVPFLDHRLVELLASVPEAHHAELFWDKTILRRAAARWLPDALRHRPKVGFFRSRDLTSIEELSRRLVRRCFPGFLERYGSVDAIFDRESLADLFTDVDLPGQAGRTAVHVLFGAMSIAIFDRLCRDLGREVTRDRVANVRLPASPLSEVDAAFLHGWVRLDDDDRVQLDTETTVALAPHVSVFSALADDDDICLARDGTIEQEMTVPEESAWIRPVLKALVATSSPVPAGELARLAGVPIAELDWLLQFLADAEWVILRPANN